MDAENDDALSPRRTVSRQFEARFALILASAALPFAAALCIVLATVPQARAVLVAHWPWLFAATLVGVSGIAWIRRILFRRVEELREGARHFGVLGRAEVFDPAGFAARMRDRAITVARERGEATMRVDQLRLVIESMPFACIAVDAQMRVTEWNAAAERLFGYRRDEMLGRDPIEVIVPTAERAAVRGLIAALADDSPPGTSTNRNLRSDGGILHCEWSNRRLVNPAGELVGYLSMAMDVSARSKIEADLQVSQARFRQLALLSSDWYWEQDENFRFVVAEAAGHGARGAPGERAGMTRWEHPGFRPLGTTWEEHRRMLEQHRPFADLLIEITDDAGLRSVASVRGEPWFDESGVFRGYRGVGSDVTARHRNEVVRVGERSVFEMLARNAPLPELMRELCRMVRDALSRTGYVSVLLLEGGRLMPLAECGVPEAMMRVTAEGIEPGALNGSCGAAAALNEVVVCADIANDARWAQYRELAREAGVASSWSTPVRGANDGLLATFAVYCPLALEPMPEDLDLTAAAASLAGVLIERFRADEALRESDARYRRLVELSEDGVALHDERGIRYANPALARILGAPDAGSLVGVDLYERLESESQALAARRRRRVLESGQTAPYAEFRLRRLDGEVIDIESAGNPVEVGGRRMVQTYVRDITRRKWVERELQRVNESLEQRVEERTRELTNVNRELESFSYTVAHDLRAPLRAIDGYAKMIVADGGAQLPEGMRHDLDRIVGSAQHMAELIDGLLEFSRLSRGAASFQRIPMRSLVQVVVAEARAAYRHEVEVVVDDLPDVYGDPDMMRQVWVNLIFNAFKFTARTAGARLHVGSSLRDGEVAFSVSDNGAGFDASYASKLFGIFQRLHSRAEFDGTGVGLAIVRRVIERHFGRVWAEGASGAGATFHFALPATSCVIAPVPLPAGESAADGG